MLTNTVNVDKLGGSDFRKMGKVARRGLPEEAGGSTSQHRCPPTNPSEHPTPRSLSVWCQAYVKYEQNQDSLTKFAAIAERLGSQPATLALAWLIKHGNALLPAGVVPIPGTSNPKHVIANCGAAALADALTDEDMADIEAAVPKVRE